MLLGVGCSSIGDGVRDTISSPEPKSIDQNTADENVALVERQFSEAQRQNREAVANFERSLVQLNASYQSRFSSSAIEASEKASGKQAIALTVYYLAKDQIYNQSEVMRHLEQNVGPILTPTMNAFALDVEKRSAQFENNLRTISISLAAGLHSVGRDPAQGGRYDVLRSNNWNEFDQALKNLGYKTTYVGMRVAFNTQGLMGTSITPQLIKPIASIAARVFSKSIARLIAAGSLAIVEGPLPIGKIITVVSVLWTGHELSQLQPRFQEEVLSATTVKLDSVRSDIGSRARRFAREQTTAFDSLQLEMRDQALKQHALPFTSSTQ
jgi:hypothetical protein